MNLHAQPDVETALGGRKERLHTMNWERMGILYARVAVGTAFLSAVAGRFGLWDRTLDTMHFANFLQYAGQVLSFMPKATIPYLACVATLSETSLGILLILGLWPRWVALASAVLLVMFGTAMAISFGLKSPMDYSVYSASGAAVLLALHGSRQPGSAGSQ
jgi:putative oxidoreductase